MSAKHASVRIGGYDVPIIGIPPSATEYKCDGCQVVCKVEQLAINETGDKFLCEQCRRESELTKKPNVSGT